MNQFSCLNVKKGFIKDYNVFKDFYESEILVYILVVWMQFFGMYKMEGF